MAAPAPLSAADRAWLGSLEERLWERRVDRMRANMSGHTWDQERWSPRKVRLKKAEWERVLALVAAHELPVGLSNASFCFGLALNVYGHATPPDRPEHIVSVSGEHLPGYRYPRDRNGFDIGWKHFAAVAQAPRNAELLAFYGMDPIKDKGHYDY